MSDVTSPALKSLPPVIASRPMLMLTGTADPVPLHETSTPIATF